ncbi:MAG: hypothetical protein MRK02_07875 [Candidatus Scalindua sp.]|nr:hypothetical protein [Candidatus Scalindua sp.]
MNLRRFLRRMKNGISHNALRFQVLTGRVRQSMSVERVCQELSLSFLKTVERGVPKNDININHS